MYMSRILVVKMFTKVNLSNAIKSLVTLYQYCILLSESLLPGLSIVSVNLSVIEGNCSSLTC